jgi:hypothetical protein
MQYRYYTPYRRCANHNRLWRIARYDRFRPASRRLLVLRLQAVQARSRGVPAAAGRLDRLCIQWVHQQMEADCPVLKGSLQVGADTTIHPKYHTVVLSTQPGQNGVLLRRPDHLDAEEDTHLILAAGEPLDQPVVQYGPFVMNTEKQTREAIMDFRMGKNGFERAPGWQSEIGKALRG